MSYNEADAYETIAQDLEEGNSCVKHTVISMTEKQLARPQITEQQKVILNEILGLLSDLEKGSLLNDGRIKSSYSNLIAIKREAN